MDTGNLLLSPRYCALLGYDAAQFRPNMTEWLDYVHPEDRPRLEREIQECLTSTSDATGTDAHRAPHARADGGWKWVLVRGMILERDGAGLPLRAAGTWPTSANAPPPRKARMWAVVDATPGAVLVADKSGRYATPTRSCARSFGYEGSMAGRSIEQLAPEAMRSNGRVRELFSRPNLPGRVLCAVRADGSSFPAMVHMSPVELGGQELVIMALRDMTQRQRAEEALHASSERYRQIVQTAAEGIWMTNADDRTTFVNPTLARMLDYDIEQMMGRAMTDFMDDSGRALLKQHLQRSLSARRARATCFLRSDGSTVWCLLSTTVMNADSGHYAGMLAMLTDITARRQAEARCTNPASAWRPSSTPSPTGW
jgi:PAS domain S-box-containing protein